VSSAIAVDWQPAAHMIKAAQRDAQPFEALMEKSGALLPSLGDPLNLPWPSLREEWYSDWLAWVFERMDAAGPVLRLLGFEAGVPAKAAFSVEREVAMPEGRPDIVLYCGDSVKFGVEIKTSSKPGREQLERYASGFDRDNLVLVACEDIEPGGWRFRSWRHVALNLRTWAAGWLREGRAIDAAMTLALCGAVEQNLLGFGSNKPQAQAYIEEWLGENRHGR
jgi:hypothetical protein